MPPAHPPLSRDEYLRIKSRVAMSLCNLATFNLFWIPAERRVMARSVSVRRHFYVPEGAVLVGKYCWPLSAVMVLEDLAELLEAEPKPVAKPGPTTIAQPRPIPGTRWPWQPPRFASFTAKR